MCQVGCVCYEKIPMSLRATNVSINCTSSPRFAPTFMQFRNDPKCIEILWNRLKHLFRFHQGGLGVFVEKILSWLRGSTFALIAPVHPVLHRVWCSYETIPDGPKHYETHQNMSLGSNGVDQVRSLRKIITWLRGTNFVLIAPVQYVLHQISCTYERSEMHPTTTKHTETLV